MSEQWTKWISELETYLGERLSSEFPWHFLDEFLEKIKKKEGSVNVDTVILEDLVLPYNTIIKAPCRIEGDGFIGANCVIGPYAYLRGGFVLGHNVHVGNSEIKHSIILANSNAPHFNYVGDSVIGNDCNLGAGTKIGNLRLDEKNIKIHIAGKNYETGLRKLGVIMEDDVKTGCNVVINPGSYMYSGARVAPNKTYPEKFNKGWL